MKKILILILSLAAAAAFFCSCGSGEASEATARIGTWNLEWFGALGRSEDDIRQIAAIIRELEVDVLALQEITCPCAMEQLAAELPGYEYFISPQRVPQKLALLWNSERVGEVRFDRDAYDALWRVADTGLDRESRQPLVFRLDIGEFDFTLVVVHLKSIPEAERSVEIRNVQFGALNSWLRAELEAEGAERDIIIAGDFNSYTRGISSERLLAAGLVEFATANLPSGEYSNIWYGREGGRNLSLIDQIAVTPELRAGEMVGIEPIRDWDAEIGPRRYEERVSDHLPVVAVFRTDSDID